MLNARVKNVTILTNPSPPRPMAFSITVDVDDSLETVVELVNLKSPFNEVAELDKLHTVDAIVALIGL
jgi:bifunctional DNase/RNase